MKRLWIGIGLLTAMLLAGILVPQVLEFCHEPIAEDLERASSLALEKEWDRAAYLADRAEEKWEKNKPVTASFADHGPMDDIDGMFDQLEIYAEAKDSVSFSATCVYLVSRLEVLGDYHDLTFESLF